MIHRCQTWVYGVQCSKPAHHADKCAFNYVTPPQPSGPVVYSPEVLGSMFVVQHGWRWMKGMRIYWYKSTIYQSAQSPGGEVNRERMATRLIGDDPSAAAIDGDPYPDLEDSATRGCITDLVAELWGAPIAVVPVMWNYQNEVRTVTGWQVLVYRGPADTKCLDVGVDRAHALFFAMHAVEAR